MSSEFAFSLNVSIIAALLLVVCLALKRVLDKRSKDYRPSYGVAEVNPKEYKRQMKITTAQELYKLRQSKEYKLMKSVKGDSREEWNWQNKEKLQPTPTWPGVNEDELENELLRVDQEIKASGGAYLKSNASSPSGKNQKRP